MKTRGSKSLRPSRLSTRRFTFLTLLLLAVAAPAGLVFAGERKSPYIVVFRDEAVTQSVAESGSYFVRTFAQRELRNGIPAAQVTTSAGDASLRIRVGKTAAAGRYTMTLISNGGDVERSTTIVLHVISSYEAAALTAFAVNRAGGF